jgi:hypothetical protein
MIEREHHPIYLSGNSKGTKTTLGILVDDRVHLPSHILPAVAQVENLFWVSQQ